MFKVFRSVAAACCVTLSQGAVMDVAPVEGNATPVVRAVAARLKDGDTLRFAKGEYHFFEEGTKEMFLASVGSSTGMKKVVVHLEGLKDVTIDGGGASFIFHGDTFPFVAERCDGVKICSFTSRVFQLPLVIFVLGWFGIVTSAGLREKRRIAIVLAFILSMLLTPPDPMSQLFMALPLCLLYEVSIWAVWLKEKGSFRR